MSSNSAHYLIAFRSKTTERSNMDSQKMFIVTCDFKHYNKQSNIHKLINNTKVDDHVENIYLIELEFKDKTDIERIASHLTS